MSGSYFQKKYINFKENQAKSKREKAHIQFKIDESCSSSHIRVAN